MGRDISVTFPRKSQANDHLTTLVESLGPHQGCSFLESTCPSLPVSTCGRHKVARFIPSLSSVCSVLLLTRLPGGEGAATVPCAPLQLPAVRLHTLWDLHPASGTPSGGKTPLGSSPLPTLAQMQPGCQVLSCYWTRGDTGRRSSGVCIVEVSSLSQVPGRGQPDDGKSLFHSGLPGSSERFALSKPEL